VFNYRGDIMINKKLFKNAATIFIIIFLFFSFNLLAGFTQVKTKTPLPSNNGNTFLDDTEENDNGDKDKSGKSLNIEGLISLVQEATSKHLEVLQEILENVQGPAKKGIERAIEVSVRGSIRAIEALSNIKNSNKGNKNNGEKTFHIISSCNRGGTIEPKGFQFSEGESIGFTITPEEGYELVWIRVDNEKLETISTYSFDDIDSNHTIHAHFKKIKNSSTLNNEVD
jgi:hypothetical protein